MTRGFGPPEHSDDIPHGAMRERLLFFAKDERPKLLQNAGTELFVDGGCVQV